MATNEILQIVVFSMFFGVALNALGEGPHAARRDRRAVARDADDHRLRDEARPHRGVRRDGRHVAVNGLEILLRFAVFMGDFYVGLIILWGLLIFAGFVVLGPRVFKLIELIKEAFMLSFATASSRRPTRRSSTRSTASA